MGTDCENWPIKTKSQQRSSAAVARQTTKEDNPLPTPHDGQLCFGHLCFAFPSL